LALVFVTTTLHSWSRHESCFYRCFLVSFTQYKIFY
jgi:hypothetical protein